MKILNVIYVILKFVKNVILKLILLMGFLITNAKMKKLNHSNKSKKKQDKIIELENQILNLEQSILEQEQNIIFEIKELKETINKKLI